METFHGGDYKIDHFKQNREIVELREKNAQQQVDFTQQLAAWAQRADERLAASEQRATAERETLQQQLTASEQKVAEKLAASEQKATIQQQTLRQELLEAEQRKWAPMYFGNLLLHSFDTYALTLSTQLPSLNALACLINQRIRGDLSKQQGAFFHGLPVIAILRE